MGVLSYTMTTLPTPLEIYRLHLSVGTIQKFTFRV